MISMSQAGIKRYIPLLGIQACAAGHQPQRVPTCLVSSVQVEHFLNSAQTAESSALFEPILAFASAIVVINPSVKKYPMITAKHIKATPIKIPFAHLFMDSLYMICVFSYRASINALHRSK
jgi:hypothetical protein